MSRTGGEAVVERLVAHGVRTTFGVPGESYLPVLDALLDTDIRVVTCRHEGGAAFMAISSKRNCMLCLMQRQQI